MDAADQRALDHKMISLDGTPTKSRLGANAILAVSMAAARAAAIASEAAALQISFALFHRYFRESAPRAHDEHPQWRRARRQFRGLPGIHGHARRRAEFFRSAALGRGNFHALKAALKKRGYSTAVGDEGGFAPSLKSNEEAIQIVLEAITAAGYKPGEQMRIALDPASSEFYDKAAGSTFSRSPTSA